MVDNAISLAERYPLEFSRFLQTGTMDFTISLYDLDKLRPGVCRRRLEQVVVTVHGLVPASGFTGHIIHRGFFTLRDEQSTLTASRLIPLETELERAVADLRSGKTQGDPIGGVIPFSLDEDRQELSGAPQPNETNPDPAAVALFEGYGETGHWTLLIDGVNLRNIADVSVQFTINFPEPNDQITAKVEDLLRRYEAEQGDALDQTVAFSLRQRFPDAFFALESGAGSLLLEDSDFLPNLTDLKVKAVVAQVVDVEGRGVAGVRLDVTRADPAFEVTRTTGEGGFTESLDAEIPVVPPADRVPLLGAWQVRLPDPTQFALLDDLRLFFIYEFTTR